MGNIVAIDTSAIIWDNNDFENNKHHYYNLVKEINTLFSELLKADINILLRKELQKEMINGFLFSELPDEYYDVGETFYSFFGKVVGKTVEYHDRKTPYLTSTPNQIKEHFNQNTKIEVEYLLSEMHFDTNEVFYFTFEYLWVDNDNLKTKVNEQEKEHNTVISDKNNQLQQFIDRIIPKFEHNPKHDISRYHSKEYWLTHPEERNGFVSQLSCYNGRDNFEPQRILDEKYPKLINDCYYGWDKNNEVYVVFRKTRDNIFHAYDEYDINKIPEEVKNHFHIKRKYRWHH